MRPVFCRQELLATHSIPPLVPDHLCLGPWYSSRNALEANTNYPCCCTWRIEAHFAAGAAHFPASVSNCPHPPHCPRSAQVATPPTSRVCLHSKLYREERHWSSVSLTSRPAGYRMPLSWQKLILQLLPLAQAACDYLKPQPFIYEKREPDIRLIDGHLLKYQLLVERKTDLLCLDNGVIFRFVSLFSPPL